MTQAQGLDVEESQQAIAFEEFEGGDFPFLFPKQLSKQKERERGRFSFQLDGPVLLGVAGERGWRMRGFGLTLDNLAENASCCHFFFLLLSA